MAYHVSIDLFEGPLDLLLHLVGQARIDIRDIFVSQIVEQYLAFMEQLPTQDMERATEFLTMAAQLLEIKSRRLLPGATQEELEEAELQEEELIRQLEEIQQYRQVTETLAQMKETAALMYTRLADERYQDERIQAKDMTLEALTRAFLRLQERLQEDRQSVPAQQVHRDVFTVKEKLLDIRRRLLRTERLDFMSLLMPQTTREEVVVTFMAILELVKDGTLFAWQDTPDGCVWIRSKKAGGE